MTVAEGQVEHDLVRIFATIASVCKLAERQLQVAMALDIDLAVLDSDQSCLVQSHVLAHLCQSNEHLFATILQ